uniref:Immunoglobulin domain-containing protein n=1 Tax=Sander lucioperca TaxID=283035 RepID=A0A8C9ZZY5_SANLU
MCHLIFPLSFSIFKSSAVTPVFVQKGEDVLLNVTIADVREEDTVTWRFNKTVNLVRFLPGNLGTKVSDDYSGRIELLVKYSVKLKNLQEADSGVYTAVVSGDKEKQITEYKITVQDPVSPVKLSVDSVSNSSDWCNLTVSCRAQDSHINSTFRCDTHTHTCSQEGGERSQVTPSAADLHVYLSNGYIICNHSNQVSCTKDIKIIENVCPRHAGKTERLNHKQLIIMHSLLNYILKAPFAMQNLLTIFCPHLFYCKML